MSTEKPQYHILVVDDEQPITDVLQEGLTAFGFDCSTAQGGAEALTILEKSPVDVVITDIRMPDMDGAALTRVIKERFTADVIVMTGFIDEFSYEEMIEQGASDFIEKPFRISELILRLRRVLRERDLAAKQKKTIAALEESEKRLRRLSYLDSLTEIANRRYFKDIIHREWQRGIRDGAPLSLLMLDIDYFKQFNDAHGHLRGDEALKAVAHTLQASVQRPGDIVARYGGEEFAVILPDTSLTGAVRVAEHMRRRVEQLAIPHPASPVSDVLTVSLGIASRVPTDTVSHNALIQSADMALYRAKAEGRNRCSVAEPPPVIAREPGPARKSRGI